MGRVDRLDNAGGEIVEEGEGRGELIVETRGGR